MKARSLVWGTDSKMLAAAAPGGVISMRWGTLREGCLIQKGLGCHDKSCHGTTLLLNLMQSNDHTRCPEHAFKVRGRSCIKETSEHRQVEE